ncbi:NAD(P)/FAD-dependent oxidoreductase [Magnetococcales bacterium HHB-1]
MKLPNNARIAIIGGGPAGSMTGFFLLELAERIGMKIHVDIYEARNFQRQGPAGCNMCAGVVSESLVQTLAAEGINLPPMVVQRGIDSYVLHTSDLDPVKIHTPTDDLRIATVYRGSGPRFTSKDNVPWTSFDAYLLDIAKEKGAQIIQRRAKVIALDDGFPTVTCKKGETKKYDFLVGAVGVNSPTLKTFENLGFLFQAPICSRGFLSEVYLGQKNTQKHLGNSMHIFLLDIPGLKFAALIPKAEYVTICLLGEQIDAPLIRKFMESPEVLACFPPGIQFNFAQSSGCAIDGDACHCMPRLNIGPATHPYTDRIALVGDAAVSRLYKDGIGAAYNTAKACAVTAIFLGIGRKDFKKFYAPICDRIVMDNRIGRVIFFITLFYQKLRLLRQGMVEMVKSEKASGITRRSMSRVLWDTFTGSATYREIFFRSLHPIFFFQLGRATLRGLLKQFIKNK